MTQSDSTILKSFHDFLRDEIGSLTTFSSDLSLMRYLDTLPPSAELEIQIQSGRRMLLYTAPELRGSVGIEGISESFRSSLIKFVAQRRERSVRSKHSLELASHDALTAF